MKKGLLVLLSSLLLTTASIASENTAKGLNVMDTTAFTLSQENKLPIIVFDMNKDGNLLKVCEGETIGTTVTI